MGKLIAVVTGGTRGIGLGIVEALLKRGASVAVTYRNDEKAAQKARQQLDGFMKLPQQLLFLKGDGGDPAVVTQHARQVYETLGPVNVLVNNAGIMPQKSFDAISFKEWDETIRVNLSSAFYWCAQVIPGMKAAGFGRIVNVSSLAARGGGVVGPHYAASKAGMLGLTRYGARELGPFGITVNAIAPAFIGDAGIFADWSREQKAALKEKVVVSRIGQVKDVVRAFEYLLDADFVTGVTLDVCGGAFMI
ncbi:MAG: SDR family NAD(P)-dependent oxidoreductase [Thermodesulfobacteriota bacterium]